MLNGYVTYEELKLITGFSDAFLKNFINKGVKEKIINVPNTKGGEFKVLLYNLNEIEECVKIWL